MTFQQKTVWGTGKLVRVAFGLFASLVLIIMALLVLTKVDIPSVFIAIPTIIMSVYLFLESTIITLVRGKREVIEWKNLLHGVSLVLSPLLLYIGIVSLPNFGQVGVLPNVSVLNGLIILIGGGVVGLIEAFVD